MDKTAVIYITFLCDVACQKILKLANVSPSYSKNNTGTVFLRHGVYLVCYVALMHAPWLNPSSFHYTLQSTGFPETSEWAVLSLLRTVKYMGWTSREIRSEVIECDRMFTGMYYFHCADYWACSTVILCFLHRGLIFSFFLFCFPSFIWWVKIYM